MTLQYDPTNTYHPRMTHHAQVRWFQRFPDVPIAEEWTKAKRLSKARRKKLLSTHKRHVTKEAGRYFLLGPHGVLFVCQQNVVITVLRAGA